MTGLCSIYVTVADRARALAIARDLVGRRLVACANVFEHVDSVFRWHGEVCEEGEAALIAKTRSDLVADVIARIRDIHEYDCPCIVAWPIEQGNPAYLDWVRAETVAADNGDH